MGTLKREKDNSIVAGVCSGLAEYFKTDATLVRIAFIVLTFFGGLGIILYLILIIIMPIDETNVDQPVNTSHVPNSKSDLDRENHVLFKDIDKRLSKSHNGSHGMFGFVIILIGIILLTNNFFPDYNLLKLWPLILILLGVAIMFKHHEHK